MSKAPFNNQTIRQRLNHARIPIKPGRVYNDVLINKKKSVNTPHGVYEYSSWLHLARLKIIDFWPLSQCRPAPNPCPLLPYSDNNSALASMRGRLRSRKKGRNYMPSTSAAHGSIWFYCAMDFCALRYIYLLDLSSLSRARGVYTRIYNIIHVCSDSRLSLFPFVRATLSRQSDELDDRNVADVLQHRSTLCCSLSLSLPALALGQLSALIGPRMTCSRESKSEREL